MSNSQTRQSLKALQERLASRLAAAQVSGADAAWLAVEAHGQRFLLPLVQSGEIFPVPFVQRVPYTQPWFLGVAALRGGLMGVVDLGGMLAPGRLSPVRVKPSWWPCTLHWASMRPCGWTGWWACVAWACSRGPSPVLKARCPCWGRC